MFPSPAAAPLASKPALPQQEVWENLIGIVARQVGEQSKDLAARLAVALLEAAETGCEARLVHQRAKAGNLLKNNTYAFCHLLADGVEMALRHEIAQLVPPPKALRRAGDQALALVPYEEMDSRVLFGAAARPFDVEHGEQLAILNVRLAFLLDRDILRGGQNPFRPEIFVMALQRAWCEFEPDPESHGLLLPLLRPDLFLELGTLFESLNLALMRKGLVGGARQAYSARKTDSPAQAPKQSRAQAVLARQLRQFLDDGATAPEVAANVAAGVAAEFAAGFAAQVADEFAGMVPLLPEMAFGPNAAAGAIAHTQGSQTLGSQILQKLQPSLSKQPLLAYLASLQTSAPASGASAPANVFYLPKIKENLPKGSLSRGDEHTIDLLGKIFETVSVDQALPDEIRNLIHFLQIPVLKTALLDKDFFFQEEHPARRLIDLLTRMGWEQRKGPDDPLFQAMQRSVMQVGSAPGPERSAFAQAVAELEASIQADEAVAAQAIAEPIASALKQEKRELAAKSAQHAVALRLGTGEVVAVVEAFLEKKWVSVLTIAYSVEDEKPGAVKNAIHAMDELIWSVKPKLTPPQRKELIAKLPALLSALNKWLDIIQWQDAERLEFFADLAECHASIVRAPLELAPERQMELAIEAAKQDAQRRVEQDSAVAPLEAAPQDDALASLQRGMWLEFIQAEGAPRHVKLAWVSPLRTLYIFSTRSRQEAFSMSADKLAQAFHEQQARLVALDGVVGRALTQALADVAVNDADGEVTQSQVA